VKDKNQQALFILKTTMEEDFLKHIREIDNPKTTWDIFAALFSKTNDAQLQHLENQLTNISKKT